MLIVLCRGALCCTVRHTVWFVAVCLVYYAIDLIRYGVDLVTMAGGGGAGVESSKVDWSRTRYHQQKS